MPDPASVTVPGKEDPIPNIVVIHVLLGSISIRGISLESVLPLAILWDTRNPVIGANRTSVIRIHTGKNDFSTYNWPSSLPPCNPSSLDESPLASG